MTPDSRRAGLYGASLVGRRVPKTKGESMNIVANIVAIVGTRVRYPYDPTIGRVVAIDWGTVCVRWEDGSFSWELASGLEVVK